MSNCPVLSCLSLPCPVLSCPDLSCLDRHWILANLQSIFWSIKLSREHSYEVPTVLKIECPGKNITLIVGAGISTGWSIALYWTTLLLTGGVYGLDFLESCLKIPLVQGDSFNCAPLNLAKSQAQ